jgi:endoglucanase
MSKSFFTRWLIRDQAVQAKETGDSEDINAKQIPRWRGFNLQGDFASSGGAYEEADFAFMANWGFDFARLPLSYWVWSSPENWTVIHEEPLREIDRAVELGAKYKIHVNLNLHRIPGYCINDRHLEPADLFAGTQAEREKALSAAVFHWRAFAARYKGIPNSRLSFDLINEPPRQKSEQRYVEIVTTLVAGIRAVDPHRLIFVDGIDIGQTPVIGIADLGVVQSTRGYLPKAISHYQANWVPTDEFETFKPPTWPLTDDLGRTWNQERLEQEYIAKYQPLVDGGVTVHVGEWGVFNKTLHAVALAWMEDSLSLWKKAGWGFALWNLRGSFGVLDSERHDVKYENYKGHKLDRKMLELLKAY